MYMYILCILPRFPDARPGVVADKVERWPQMWEISSLVPSRESKLRLIKVTLELPSLILSINRRGPALVISVNGISGHDAGNLLCQWSSTIKSPRVHTVTS